MSREALVNGSFTSDLSSWGQASTAAGFATGTESWIWDATSACGGSGAAEVDYPDTAEYTSDILTQTLNLIAGTYKVTFAYCNPDTNSRLTIGLFDGVDFQTIYNTNPPGGSGTITVEFTTTRTFATFGIQWDRLSAGNIAPDSLLSVSLFTFITVVEQPAGFRPVGAGDLIYEFLESSPFFSANYRLEIEYDGLDLPIASFRPDLDGVIEVNVAKWLRTVLRMSDDDAFRFDSTLVKYQAKWDGGQDTQTSLSTIYFYVGYDNWYNHRTQFEITSAGGPFLCH